MDKLEAKLITAVRDANLEAIKSLLKQGCRVDVPDGDNVTPLHLAAARDHIEVAKLLLANGADINLKSADKMAALHFAAARGFTEMVRMLLDTGAHVDALDSSDRTALHLAVSRGHLDVVQILLEHGAKINIEEIHGYTPLCEAVWQKSVELAQLLLDAGAKLTQSHYLLHYAVLHQHLSMAELLLNAGSIPNLRDDNGDTPLIIAARTHNVGMAKLLLENGALPGYTNSLSGSTPLHESISNNHSDDRNTSLEAFVEVLIYHGVDLNICSPLIGTALTKALLTGKYKTAEFLIQVGADVNKVPNDMSVPFSNLQIALRRQRFPLVKLIVAAGYDLVHGTPDLVWPGDTKDLNVHSPIGWLLITKFNPRRLSDICRSCIRKDLGIRVSDIVPKLYLPKCLQQFLMLEGICNEVNLREISFPETYTIVPPLLRYR